MTSTVVCSVPSAASSFALGVLGASVPPVEPPDELAVLTRRFRSTRSAVVVQCTQACLRAAGTPLPAAERRGLVLGTTTGAGADIERFLADAVHTGDHLANPALFPVTVHNAAAGHAAMAGDCRGPNIVLSAGRPSVWVALDTALAVLADGSADLVLTGGFESRRLADGTIGTLAVLVALSGSAAALSGRTVALSTLQELRRSLSHPESEPSDDRPVPKATTADRAGSLIELVGFAQLLGEAPAVDDTTGAGASAAPGLATAVTHR